MYLYVYYHYPMTTIRPETYTEQIPPGIQRIKIDVGLSYGAPQSQIWLNHDKDLFVFGFEPNQDNIDCIKAGNIQKKHPAHGTPLSDENANRFIVIPVALGGQSDNGSTMDFYQMKNDSGTSSLKKPIDPSIGPIQSIIQVPVWSLKHFFDHFPWERFPLIEYLKIDAQGYDLDILKGAGDYLRERVIWVTAEPEWAPYENCGHNTSANIRIYMESQGFEFVHHPNTSDPTFVNTAYKDTANHIFIYQKG